MKTRTNNNLLLMTRDMVEPFLIEDQPKPGFSLPGQSMANSGITAVIPIVGALCHRSNWRMTYSDIWEMISGCLEDDRISTIVLDIDSGGGEVSGCFDLMDRIYAARGAKPLIACVNDYCCSAAYAIASACDSVFVSETSIAGSIGVICVHVEYSKMDTRMGVTVTEVFAGDHKNDFSPDSPLTESAKKKLQEDVETLYDMFCSRVARNRGLSTEQVKATQAATYLGMKAVDIGLADGIATFDQTLTNLLGGNYGMGLKEDLKKLQTMHGGSFDLALKELGFVPVADVPDVEKIKSEAKTAMDTAVSNAKSAAKAELEQTITAISDAIKLAQVTDAAFAVECVAGLDVEAAKTKIINAQADESDRTQVFAKHSGNTVTGKSPMVADAEKRAAKAEAKRRGEA